MSEHGNDLKGFPPVPAWRPDFWASPIDILERMIYYTDNSRDIAMFKYGTLVLLADGLTNERAEDYARKVLGEVYHNHPDMLPQEMDDGNILIEYKHPVFSIVINDFADKYLDLIKINHLSGLTPFEVLMTPLGPNIFDEFGMKALYGRTFMFLDAQDPCITHIYRIKK